MFVHVWSQPPVRCTFVDVNIAVCAGEPRPAAITAVVGQQVGTHTTVLARCSVTLVDLCGTELPVVPRITLARVGAVVISRTIHTHTRGRAAMHRTVIVVVTVLARP